jgi:hypothetical protein
LHNHIAYPYFDERVLNLVSYQGVYPVTALSIRFAKAIAAGRRTPPPPATREHLLVALLHKRAIAHNLGADDLEYMLRQQILWSLPTFKTEHIQRTVA